MFDNVIAGLDGSDAGRDALTLARQLASPRAQLTLAYVQVVTFKPEPDSGAVSLARERRPVVERIATLRDEARLDATVLSVEARTVAKGLHDLAVAGGADLLVVGASGGDEYERTLVGDDTAAVLENAPCPVAVAPAAHANRPPHLRKIAAAYDGSPQSERALAVARELARDHRAELSAFQAVRETFHPDAPWDPQPQIDERLAEARGRMAALQDVEGRAASGNSVEELARYGASVDLLVVGSHEYGPTDRLLSDTTAQRLAARAPCALLVLDAHRPPGSSDPGTTSTGRSA